MIDILLATYNGGQYLTEQIESIINQTYKEWTLYIRDDGSTDNTLKIVNKYIVEYPQKIILIKDNKKGLGAKLNFAELIKYSKNKYCMFSDQDDYWLSNKIEITLKKMKDLEGEFGNSEPILIHTNLKVVDKDLHIIDNSFWNLMNINPKRNKLNNIMVENVITGCTTMLNRALIECVDNIPIECLMHDWWIGIVASTFGKIGIIEEPTILYRQHGSNEVGAKKEGYINRIKKKIKTKSKIFAKELKQMEKFYEIYQYKMDFRDKKLIEEFISIPNRNFIIRRNILIKNKIFLNKLINNIKNIIFI